MGQHKVNQILRLQEELIAAEAGRLKAEEDRDVYKAVVARTETPGLIADLSAERDRYRAALEQIEAVASDPEQRENAIAALRKCEGIALVGLDPAFRQPTALDGEQGR